jgi:hypothetical protein|tara:strand:- start:314 stop:487 length:174 start_codon:yes stop_codon:yes gene_type:complete
MESHLLDFLERVIREEYYLLHLVYMLNLHHLIHHLLQLKECMLQKLLHLHLLIENKN